MQLIITEVINLNIANILRISNVTGEVDDNCVPQIISQATVKTKIFHLGVEG